MHLPDEKFTDNLKSMIYWTNVKQHGYPTDKSTPKAWITHKYACFDLNNKFNDSDRNRWKLLLYYIHRTFGLEGPYDFDTL